MNRQNRGNSTTAGFVDYRDFLLTRRAELLANLQAEFHTLVRPSGSPEEALSQAMQDQFVAVQIRRLDFFQLKLVDAALGRMNKSAGGACVDCGGPISDKRRESIPWAIRCIKCQESAGTHDS